MDAQSFDALSRRVGAAASRRLVVASFLSGLLRHATAFGARGASNSHCRASGTRCERDAACCSRRCRDGACAGEDRQVVTAAAKKACLGPGKRCKKSAQCCSGVCQKKRKAKKGKCSCLGSGQSCSSGAAANPCCSGTCRDGACRDEGAPIGIPEPLDDAMRDQLLERAEDFPEYHDLGAILGEDGYAAQGAPYGYKQQAEFATHLVVARDFAVAGQPDLLATLLHVTKFGSFGESVFMVAYVHDGALRSLLTIVEGEPVLILPATAPARAARAGDAGRPTEPATKRASRRGGDRASRRPIDRSLPAHCQEVLPGVTGCNQTCQWVVIAIAAGGCGGGIATIAASCARFIGVGAGLGSAVCIGVAIGICELGGSVACDLLCEQLGCLKCDPVCEFLDPDSDPPRCVPRCNQVTGPCSQCDKASGACIAVSCEAANCLRCDPGDNQCKTTCPHCTKCDGAGGCVEDKRPCQYCEPETGAFRDITCPSCTSCDPDTGLCRPREACPPCTEFFQEPDGECGCRGAVCRDGCCSGEICCEALNVCKECEAPKVLDEESCECRCPVSCDFSKCRACDDNGECRANKCPDDTWLLFESDGDFIDEPEWAVRETVQGDQVVQYFQRCEAGMCVCEIWNPYELEVVEYGRSCNFKFPATSTRGSFWSHTCCPPGMGCRRHRGGARQRTNVCCVLGAPGCLHDDDTVLEDP